MDDPLVFGGYMGLASIVGGLAFTVLVNIYNITQTCGCCTAVLLYILVIVPAFFIGVIGNGFVYMIAFGMLCKCPFGCVFALPAFVLFGFIAGLAAPHEGSTVYRYSEIWNVEPIQHVSVCDRAAYESSRGAVYFRDGSFSNGSDHALLNRRGKIITSEHCHYVQPNKKKRIVGGWVSCSLGVQPIFSEGGEVCAWGVDWGQNLPKQPESCGPLDAGGMCGFPTAYYQLALTNGVMCTGDDAHVGMSASESCHRFTKEVKEGLLEVLAFNNMSAVHVELPAIVLKNPMAVIEELDAWYNWWLAACALYGPLPLLIASCLGVVTFCYGSAAVRDWRECNADAIGNAVEDNDAE
eukprot:TRINITY_DN64706_c0_g1_i1.p1 TRINITY_DN64706_c0_g1~~TRINITY_DN64706_c0_g1_i1.p1  ORF type:complete len:352 (-),score=37.83 TRINITY_DN64706_c0_g1_i1:38-1093(-)